MDTIASRLLQRWRLRGTRLRRLLDRRHVDISLYLRATPVEQIQAQVDTCRRCGHAERCERALGSLAAGRSDYRFCPNRSAFAPFLDSAGPCWRDVVHRQTGGLP